MIQCQIYIGQRLGLNSLGCIHHQNGTVTGCKASGYLIVKVYMSGSVYQIKNILLPILCFINNTDGLKNVTPAR